MVTHSFYCAGLGLNMRLLPGKSHSTDYLCQCLSCAEWRGLETCAQHLAILISTQEVPEISTAIGSIKFCISIPLRQALRLFTSHLHGALRGRFFFLLTCLNPHNHIEMYWICSWNKQQLCSALQRRTATLREALKCGGRRFIASSPGAARVLMEWSGGLNMRNPLIVFYPRTFFFSPPDSPRSHLLWCSPVGGIGWTAWAFEGGP